MFNPKPELEAAWKWRMERGFFSEAETLRVFHGPGEGSGLLRGFSIDRFGKHFWLTRRENQDSDLSREVYLEITDFLLRKGADSVVTGIRRKGGGEPLKPPLQAKILAGQPPREKFQVSEGKAKYWIQFHEVSHPGLFLDHFPLRKWLQSRAGSWAVLNAFAYTGSLSVASALGGARHVTAIDLSRSTLRWAEENWRLNGLRPDSARWITGDVFEWFPRLKRGAELFDCVILDPPSFSRGKKGDFSTSKDLSRLHELTLDLMKPDGILITSINSSGTSTAKFAAEVRAAARSKRVRLRILGQIDLPETFPTPFESLRGDDRYLKGWILQRY